MSQFGSLILDESSFSKLSNFSDEFEDEGVANVVVVIDVTLWIQRLCTT